MADVSVNCENCGRAYATHDESYVAEIRSRGTHNFLCRDCIGRRDAAWAEREKQYRTPDGRQKRR